MRYARNQKSPFEDEQDGNAILEPIVFEDGMLLVQKRKSSFTKVFTLSSCKWEVYFQKVNKEQDAIDELHEVENVLEAQVMAKELASNTQKMIQVCRVLLGNVVDNMTIPELKRDLLIYSKNNPEDFINTINDPMLQLQDDVYQFFKAGFLQKRNNDKEIYYNLPNNKKRLLSVPFGEDPDWIVASYFQSDDGVDVYKILKNRLKKS